MCIVQGRNEVRWRPGQETGLAPPCSNLRSFGSKCTVLKKSAHDIVGNFEPPAVIRYPGNCALLPSSLRLWYYAMKIGKIPKGNKLFITSERHEHLQFSKTVRHGSRTDCQQRLQTAFQVSSCSSLPLPCLPHAFLRRGTVCFANNKSFRTLNK